MAEDWFWQSVVVLAGAFGLVMLLAIYSRMRRETRISRAMSVIAILLFVAATGLYLSITGVRVRWLPGTLFAVLGYLFGRAEAKRVRIHHQGRYVVGRRTVRHIVIWGLGYLLAIVAALMGRAGLHAVAILLMLLGAGMAVGCNLRLLSNKFRLQLEG